jgi:hypothetical protein
MTEMVLKTWPNRGRDFGAAAVGLVLAVFVGRYEAAASCCCCVLIQLKQHVVRAALCCAGVAWFVGCSSVVIER